MSQALGPKGAGHMCSWEDLVRFMCLREGRLKTQNCVSGGEKKSLVCGRLTTPPALPSRSGTAL